MAFMEIFVLVACLLDFASACFFDSDCGVGECCSSNGYCYDCVLGTGSIAGIVIGIVVFIAIIVSIVSCFCCACCPYYRYRHPGAVIVASPAGYNQFVNVTSTTSTQQCHQQPPAPGYVTQPPPYYPPQQAGPYLPPPQGSGMVSYPPPQVKGPYPQAH